jgi:hypothetical protein
LLVSFIRPHGSVSNTTIARWCKLLLSVAGVDTTNFHFYSTRAASTSYAADGNVNISCILEAVGWSNEQTFQKFYHKPCVESSFNLGSAVLDMHLCCSIVRFSFMQYLCCVISIYTNAFKVIQICSHEMFIDFYVLLYLRFTLMTSLEISYSSVTTTADDVIEFTNLTRLTCKLKLDWNSISHQPGVKEVYSLPKYLCLLPSHLFHSFSLLNRF